MKWEKNPASIPLFVSAPKADPSFTEHPSRQPTVKQMDMGETTTSL